VIEVVVGNLAECPADAVLRAADTRLDPVGAVSQRLDLQAGERFLELCQVQEPLDVGAAVVTGAGNLTAEFVLHCVIDSPERRISPDAIRLALSSAWHRAEGWHLSVIAAPPVGAGVEGIALEEAVHLLVTSFRDRPQETGFPATLHIVVESPEIRSAVEQLVRGTP